MRKEHVETPEELAIRKQKEQKEIEKLLKEKAKPKIFGYLFFFVFIITIVYLVDEVTSNIGTQMGTLIANSFFATGKGNANAVRSFAESFVMVASAIALVMRPLSDRYGRKLFLVLYTFGMGIGMFIIAVSNHWSGWLVGTFMINFCIPHDMQAIYIQECAPEKKRGTYYSVIKGIASFGIMLIPLLRKLFNVGESDNNWRYVYLVLAGVGIVISIIAAFLMRESDVYIDNRLKQLRMSEEERQVLKEQQHQDNQKYGILQGFKHVLKHKQLLWIGLSFGFVFFAYQLTSNYDVIAKNFWGLKNIENFDVLMFDSASELYNASLSASGDAYVTKFLTLWGVGAAIIQFFPGIIADKIGRKKATIFFGIATILFYVLFYIGTYNVWNPYLTGFFIGVSCGAVWSFGDLLLLMTSESVETNLRVSVNTAIYIFSGAFRGIGMGIFAVTTLILNDLSFAPVTLIMTLIGLTIGTILLMIKVKDTKNVNIDTVSASDFE